jgi:hypothetical protein
LTIGDWRLTLRPFGYAVREPVERQGRQAQGRRIDDYWQTKEEANTRFARRKKGRTQGSLAGKKGSHKVRSQEKKGEHKVRPYESALLPTAN